MKTHVRQTSIDAHNAIQDGLNRRERELYEALQDIAPASDRMLADALGWEISQVNGRRNALAGKKMVEEAYRDTSPSTGRKVIYWKISKPLQTRLF